MRPRGQSSIGYRTPLAVSEVRAGTRRDGLTGRARRQAVEAPTSTRPRGRPPSGRRARPTRCAAPPAPGPSNATRPTGSASTSIRLRTPSVRPSGESSGSAVGSDRRRERPVGVEGRGGQEPDDPPLGPGVALVGEADRGDPGSGRAADALRPGLDRGRVEPAIEGEPGEDHELVDRVVALDVAGRVGLRVPEALGLGERGRVVLRRVLVGHRAQDVVRRAVHDAADAFDRGWRPGPSRAARGPGSRRRPRPRTGAWRRCVGRSPRARHRGGRGRACWPSRRACPSRARPRSACGRARRHPSARR